MIYTFPILHIYAIIIVQLIYPEIRVKGIYDVRRGDGNRKLNTKLEIKPSHAVIAMIID